MNGELESLVGLLAVLGVLWLARWRHRWTPNLQDHGAAGFATDRALERRGFFGRKGLVLGRSVESGRLIRHRRYVNLCVLGPPGVGKSSGLSIPWLLKSNTSAFVLDIKGELYRATAHVRRRMAQKVFLLDPFNVCGEGSHSINVFDLIPSDLTCIDDIRAICESLVARTGEEKEAFWQDAAVSVLVVAMVAVALYAKPQYRNLAGVRHLLTDPGDYDPEAERMVPLINRYCFRMQDAGVPVLADLAGFVLGLEDETRGSVFAVANQNVVWMDSLAIRGITCNPTDFDIRELLTGLATLYLVLPPWALESQARFLRMIFSTFVRLVGKEGTGKQEILCLLDECGQLGAMPALDQALSLMRSYGLRLVMMFQSITQLRSTFKGKEGLVLDNAELIAFGTQSYETAKLLSDMLGAYTRVITSYSENDGRSHTERDSNPAVNVSHGSTLSVSSISRPVLSPDQILQLPNNVMLCFIRGTPVIACQLLAWWREPHLKALNARR